MSAKETAKVNELNELAASNELAKEKLLGKLYDNLPCGIGLFEAEGEKRPVYLNNAFFKLLGYTREEYRTMKKRPLESYLYAEDQKIHEAIVGQVAAAGSIDNCEYRIVVKDGTLRWVQLNVSLIRFGDLPCYLACFMDITKVKKAELASQHAEERYRLVSDSTNTAVFEFNVKTKQFYSSASFNDYALSAQKPSFAFIEERFKNVVYPEDLPILQQFFAKARSRSQKTECILRLKMKNGSYHWSRIICIFLPDRQGEIVRVVGAILDINSETEKAAIQQELINAIPGEVAIFKIGRQIQCLYYNERETNDDLRSRADLQTLFDRDDFVDFLVAPQDKSLFLKEVLLKVKQGLPVNVTFRYRRKSSQAAAAFMWIHLSAAKIRDDQGAAIYYAIMTEPPQKNMFYLSIVEDSPTAAMILDKASGNILFANQACSLLLSGKTDAVLVGKKVQSILSPEIGSKILTQAQAAVDTCFQELALHTLQGKHLLSKAKLIYWNGLDACLFYVLDQTILQRRNDQLMKLMDTIPGGMGIHILKNSHLTQFYMNEGFFRLLGSSKTEMADFDESVHASMIHPDDIHLFTEGIDKIEAGARQVIIDYRMKNKRGQYFWLRVLGKVKSWKNGVKRIYCSYFDVDKQMKLQLRLNNERQVLHMAMRTVKMSAWEYDLDSQKIYQDISAQKQHGYGSIVDRVPESLIADGYVHPKSIDVFRRLFQRVSVETGILQGDVYVQTADKKGYWWERILMTPIFDEKGRHVRSLGVSLDISEQKAIEAKYGQQLQVFNAVNSSSLIGKGLYNLSQNSVEYYYVDTKQLLQHKKNYYYDIGLELNALRVVDPQEREKFLTTFKRQNLLQQFKNGNTEVILEYQKRVSEKRIIWVQTTLKLYCDPVTGDTKGFVYSYDVNEQKKTQEMISTIVKTEYDYLALLDCRTNDYQVYANHANTLTPLPNFHSSDYEQEVAEYAHTFLVPEEAEQNIREMSIANLKKQLRDQDCYVAYASVRNQDGSISKKKLKFSYLDRNKDNILMTRVDITDIYEREQAQQQKIREANRAKTNFLSHMSHDIRTPMNTIIGLSELAQDELGDAEAMKSYVENIRSAGKFLLGLVNDCLDFEKLAAHKMVLHKVPYPYEEFRRSILLMIAPLCQKKNIAFFFSEAAPYTVCIDKVRFEQIFFNLLSNAVKYTPDGGQIQFIANSHLSKDKKLVLCDFHVWDNGIGMSREFLRHLFEPFEQEEAGNMTNRQGTGLGLSIVKELVELMGGTITVQSCQGEGTEFVVHLNMENVSQEQAKEATAPILRPQAQLAGKKILLVEDQDLNMVIAKKLLEKQKLSVVCAQNGRLGLKQFAQSPLKFFDVVLTDIRMPDLDGLKMSQTIRTLDREDAKTVPIIAMTANVFEDDLQEIRSAGMNGYIFKPIDPEVLYQELTKCLAAKEKK